MKQDARHVMKSFAEWSTLYGMDKSNARIKKKEYEEKTGETLGVYVSHNWFLIPKEAKAFFERHLNKKVIKK